MCGSASTSCLRGSGYASELARAQQAGTVFAPTKLRTVVENDTGLRRQVEVSKRVKAWWFTAENGKQAVGVRYGTLLLELAKGKWTVEACTVSKLQIIDSVKFS